MLANMFGNAHAGFGGQMQGAMDRMWDVNQSNQAQAGRRGGPGGGGQGGYSQPGTPGVGGGNGGHLTPGFGTPGQPANSRVHPQLWQAKLDGAAGRENATNFMWKARQPEMQGPLQAMFGLGGFGMGGQSPIGSLPTQFNTNYGAFGNVSNPNPQFR
jgi:hypothetical protein